MRGKIALFAALMLAFGVSFAAAQTTDQLQTDPQATEQQQGGAVGQEKTMTATVDNVNEDQKKITVTGPQGNKAEYTLSDSTMITTRDGKQMKIGDLKAGSSVTITYTGTAENPNVTSVMVEKGQ
ncbi:MAG: hypothetical protein ACYC5N_10810 [Endomicrobiales bacterium]